MLFTAHIHNRQNVEVDDIPINILMDEDNVIRSDTINHEYFIYLQNSTIIN